MTSQIFKADFQLLIFWPPQMVIWKIRIVLQSKKIVLQNNVSIKCTCFCPRRIWGKKFWFATQKSQHSKKYIFFLLINKIFCFPCIFLFFSFFSLFLSFFFFSSFYLFFLFMLGLLFAWQVLGISWISWICGFVDIISPICCKAICKFTKRFQAVGNHFFSIKCVLYCVLNNF